MAANRPVSNHGARIETFEVAGETLITTPAQTVIEQKLAEAEGLRERMSGSELAGEVGRAMQVAGAQSLLMGGGPVAVEGLGRGAMGDFRKRGTESAMGGQRGYDAGEQTTRGQLALEELLKNESGETLAMERPDVGPVFFVWGEPGRANTSGRLVGGYGLSHIIAQRNLEGLDGVSVARKLPEVIAYGTISGRQGAGTGGERVRVSHNGATAVLSLYKNGDKQTWLLTGWEDGDGGAGVNPAAAYAPDSSGISNQEGARGSNMDASFEDVNFAGRAMPDVYATGSAPGAGPAGGAGVARPEWVRAGAETGAGKRLLRRMEGRNPAGLRHVVEYINHAVGVEMRRSRSQTSGRHPAHYRPRGHFTMTRSGQSQINFHEAGHGLKELVEARAPGELDKLSGVWLALTMRPGSMASARNVHEGVAEWLRLRMVDPGAVEGSPREHHGAILPEDIGLTFSKSDEFLTKESATGWPESGNRSPDILLADSLF